MSQFFPSGGQSIRASASVLPLNIQGWFPLRLTDLISLQSKEVLDGHFITKKKKEEEEKEMLMLNKAKQDT